MTYRIAIAPKHRFSNIETLADLEARATALDVRVSIEQKVGRYWGWLVRVRRGNQVVDLRSSGPERGDCGPLLPVIAGALDDFEAAYPAWTPDELLTVAAQSGLEVRRA